MSSHKSPLRDRLLSNSPDPIKSSIIRESGMGWVSSTSDPANVGSGSSGSITSPLRIAKRDSPRILPQPQLARRSSSSYKHVTTNNLVSKSPFKSRIPPSSSIASRHGPVSFPLSRRVSGEKRPRPASMQEGAENENEYPFSLQRERRQSKGYQGLIQKEPVTKSPFKRMRSAQEQPQLQSPMPLIDLIPRIPIHSFSSDPPSTSLVPASAHVSSSGISPGRSSLVSRRMHGPRLSNGGRRERKTVIFADRCEVVEFDREEETDEELSFNNPEYDSDNYELDVEPDLNCQEERDPFHGEESDLEEGSHEQREDCSHESLHLPDFSADDSALLGIALDPNTSISGLVDEMFASSGVAAIGAPKHNISSRSDTHNDPIVTPPLLDDSMDFPVDLEVEDGVLSGRSNATRFLQRQQSHSPQQSSYFSPQSQPHLSSSQYALGLPTQKSPLGTPATLSLSSTVIGHPLIMTGSQGGSVLPITSSEPDSLDDPTYLATPPLGKSTRAEHPKKERQDDDDVLMLPGTPPPTKGTRKSRALVELGVEGWIPSFSLEIESLDVVAAQEDVDDSFSLSGLESKVVGLQHDSLNCDLSVGEIGGRLGPGVIDRRQTKGLGGALSFSQVASQPDKEDRQGEDSHPQEPEEQDSEEKISVFSTASNHTSVINIRPLSPSLNKRSSIESLGDSGGSERRRISRTEMSRHLLDKNSSPSLANASPLVASDKVGEGIVRETQNELEDKDHLSIITTMTDLSTETAVIGLAERKTLSKVNTGDGGKFNLLGPGESFGFELENRFGMRGPELGAGLIGGMGAMQAEGTNRQKGSIHNVDDSIKMGEVGVDVDMRSALDRLMDDVAGAKVEGSMVIDEGDSYEHRFPQPPTTLDLTQTERAATDSALLHNDFASRDASVSSTVSTPPPVPPKDNIRSREHMIIEKRREARRMEDEFTSGGTNGRGKRGQELLGVGRPSRRRSMSTGDADGLDGDERKARHTLLDVAGVWEGEGLSEHLGDSIQKELLKRGAAPHKQHKTKYLVRERQGTIYASSSDPDNVSHMVGPGDVHAGKAWRTVRRPSDMNEYSNQIKEYRAQEKPGKAYGKVFVKVLGVKGIHIPLPPEPTALTCTLNNGIHFVSTPECPLGKESRIDQEFELIEHNRLEFTLTLKIRRDPHIIAQFNVLAPPPIAPIPPPVSQTASRGGMRSFFSSPKKSSKDKLPPRPPASPPPPPPPQRLSENLARYLKPDGTLARAFVSFKDIASRCDARLFETSYPLIGQRFELGGKYSTLQVGEIVLQMFRLPPLPGITPGQLPQSLEECHRGLRHVNWHKMTYFEGTLTQSGGDCSTWRRRRLRVIGANLVAFNDVTKKATATIDLKKAIAVEDDQEARKNALSPGSGVPSRISRYDEYDGLYGVERSFRLLFPQDQEIIFFADADEEKARWLDVLRALVGHIPPHPLWAELLWQRQEDMVVGAQAAQNASEPIVQSPAPSWLIPKGPHR